MRARRPRTHNRAAPGPLPAGLSQPARLRARHPHPPDASAIRARWRETKGGIAWRGRRKLSYQARRPSPWQGRLRSWRPRTRVRCCTRTRHRPPKPTARRHSVSKRTPPHAHAHTRSHPADIRGQDGPHRGPALTTRGFDRLDQRQQGYFVARRFHPGFSEQIGCGCALHNHECVPCWLRRHRVRKVPERHARRPRERGICTRTWRGFLRRQWLTNSLKAGDQSPVSCGAGRWGISIITFM